MAKEEKKIEEKKVQKKHEQEPETLIRILTYDIPGSKNIYSALTKIKGVSWSIANAICVKLNLERTRRLSDFSKDEIKKIEDFIKHLDVFDFMKNRRLDRETGESKHYHGTDLELKKDFDIKRMKKIKSYKGVRHLLKLPVRGQKTRSHFRKSGKAMGVTKKK